MGAPSKRARKIRTKAEFDVARLVTALQEPTVRSEVYAWSLDAIMSARDCQLRGDFKMPARLAKSMRTDDALAVALKNRLAPVRCTKVQIEPAKGAGAGKVAGEAEALFGNRGVGLRKSTIGNIHSDLVNHGVAFGYNVLTPRADGSRIDLELRHWPIEHVRWDKTRAQFMTRVDPSSASAVEGAHGWEVPIVHGDGRWVIFAEYDTDPFTYGDLLAACLVWARHAFPVRDWMKGSKSHGDVKIVGEMPEGVPLQEDGDLSPEAAKFLDLLVAMGQGDVPIGIRPAGSKIDIVAHNSMAWQIFHELVQNAEKAAARIYLGTDGTLGAQGGAPGVDIQALFGVARTRVEGDVTVIQNAIDTGSMEPWAAMNFGDSTLAPKRVYLLPDTDADAARAAYAQRMRAFNEEIAETRANGFAITQEYVDEVAKRHGVSAPMLAAAPAPAAAA